MNRTEQLVVALRHAASASSPVRKTSRQWAAEFGVSRASAYREIRKLGLKGKVLLIRTTPRAGTIPTILDKRCNGRTVSVGNPILREAGLVAEKLAYRIDPVANTITLSAVET